VLKSASKPNVLAKVLRMAAGVLLLAGFPAVLGLSSPRIKPTPVCSRGSAQ
jgi:hypothetical protein